MGNLLSSASFYNNDNKHTIETNINSIKRFNYNFNIENEILNREILFVLDQAIKIAMIGNLTTLKLLFYKVC
jgi:hypothetical protein